MHTVGLSKAKGDSLVTSPPSQALVVKEEPSDAFFGTGYSCHGFGNRRSSGYRRGGYTQGRVKRAGRANPIGADGKVTACHICGSRMHWMRESKFRACLYEFW